MGELGADLSDAPADVTAYQLEVMVVRLAVLIGHLESDAQVRGCLAIGRMQNEHLMLMKRFGSTASTRVCNSLRCIT